MTKRTFVDSNGNSWEWGESAEATKAIERLSKTKFAGNYQGPLYAPHPDLSKAD